ncbi:alpha/beta fold hydrolase [Colwelliaceae bacterium 6441]
MINELETLAPHHFKCHFLTIAKKNTIDEILQDIKSQLPDEKVNLLGFSLGGYLASAFTVKYPFAVEQLFVVSNMPCILPDKEIKERTRTVAWINKNGYLGIPKKRIIALLDESAQTNSEIIALIKQMDDSLGQDTLIHQLLVTTKRENLFLQLSQLPLDKYFCVGDNDQLVSLDKLVEFDKQDHRMSLSIFNNTGHMLPLEKPEKLAFWLNSIVNNQ